MARSIDVIGGTFTPDELALLLTRAELVTAAGLSRRWQCRAPLPVSECGGPTDNPQHTRCSWMLYVMESDL